MGLTRSKSTTSAPNISKVQDFAIGSEFLFLLLSFELSTGSCSSEDGCEVEMSFSSRVCLVSCRSGHGWGIYRDSVGSEDVRGSVGLGGREKRNRAGRIIGENVTSWCWRRNRGEAKLIIINLQNSVPK